MSLQDLLILNERCEELEKENEQLKQQLESLKREYSEKLGYLSSNKWTDKTAISVEMERLEKEQLRDRLEHEVKMIEGAANDEIRSKNKEIESLKDMLAYEQTYVESIESRLEVAENLLHNYTVIDCGDVWETTLRAREFLKQRESYCKDCGTETKRGKGSARCPSCWEDRCGYSTDNEE